ncbi:hypothetical protein [Paraburkholderia sp. D1E]|uniref:hypothetical protein n=1 Tax=Paraburkholderia sp. D1E TaxID=3461398 RepID=UPI004045CBA0
MDLKTFYQGLSGDQRKRFAAIAGTSTAYIEVHLLPRRKMPRPRLIENLGNACAALGGAISQEDLLAFFYRASLEKQPSAA